MVQTLLFNPDVYASESLGGINLSYEAPKVITPNGDGKNDIAFFYFDSHLTGLPISGEVFDMTGAKVATLNIFSDDTKMTWDGKDNGSTFSLLGSTRRFSKVL